MKLSLKPVDIPFRVGDTVWVNQPDSKADERSYFEAKIIQIILDGSLNNTTVIRERREMHELVISSAIYDLKPTGSPDGSRRVSVEVQLIPLQMSLFETKEALLDYQNQQ